MMKKILLIVLYLIAGCSQKSEEKNAIDSKGHALTIDRILSKPSITGTSPSSPLWSADSEQLAFLWNDSGQPRREIWIVNGDGSGLHQITSENEGTGGVNMFTWTSSNKELIYLRSGDLWRISYLSGEGKRLTNTGGNKSNLELSPDGRYASFLEDGDLWIFNLKTSNMVQRTKVGVPSISSIPLGQYNRPDVEIGSYVWGGPT